jgi:hypothetical protein
MVWAFPLDPLEHPVPLHLSVRVLDDVRAQFKPEDMVEPFGDSVGVEVGVDCKNAVHVEIAVPGAVGVGAWAVLGAIVAPICYVRSGPLAAKP